MPAQLNVLPAASLTDNDAVIGPSVIPDRLTEVLTGTPLTTFTTTLCAGLPSLNVIAPLSSDPSPLTVNCSLAALARPMSASANAIAALSPISWSSCADACALNVLLAASVTDSDAVIGPSVIPDRLTELLTGTPLTMFTTTLWAGLPSLNVIAPLSSEPSPLTVNCSLAALAWPMFASANVAVTILPRLCSSCADACALNVLPAASLADNDAVIGPSVSPDRLTELAHRRPVDNVHHHIVSRIAVAERDRAIVVGAKPADRELLARRAGPADVRIRKRNRRTLPNILVELRRCLRIERVAGRVAHRQRRRDRPIRHPRQVDRCAHRRPVDNVHHHIVGGIAIAERDRAAVVGPQAR